ncbi:MAG TPA: thiamine pyrophosphate-dependent dehydrogenase E1 component subunit alpha, partial [Parachlamydiaceae bacterium]|nr:thiamine pyrophosphate-dependent dehydrogenase E1 component subunit alpha [Parachlamydiaceae bacterium]
CSVGSAAALQLADWMYPQYRESGIIFWRGLTVEEYVNHMFGNMHDPTFGRQMPNHFGKRELNVVTVSSPIGTKIPHAAGCAYAMKLQKENSVAIAYFGEGAASEGDFHCGLNFAAVRKAPVIFFCRNNGYAISTPSYRQYASDGIAAEGPGHGIKTFRIDGNDVFAVFQTVKQAREYCLKEKAPILIEAMTYRMGAHSTSDDPTLYRTIEEEAPWREKCPIVRFKKYLEKEKLWDETQEVALEEEIAKKITKAINSAKETDNPPIEMLVEHVYFEVPDTLKEQLRKTKKLLGGN